MVNHESAHVGVALGAGHLTWVDQDGGERGDAVLAPFSGDGNWPSLAAAFREMPGGASLAIALEGPLAEVRQVMLPPLQDDELLQLLARNAGSYFAQARGQQTVGITVRRTGRKAPVQVLAMTTPAILVASIHAAAHEAGLTVVSITSSEGAIAASAVAQWPSLKRGESAIVVAEQQRITLLETDGGTLRSVRRFRNSSDDITLLSDAIGSERAVAVFGDGAAALGGALGKHVRSIAVATGANDVRRSAAEGAASSAGPVLRSERVVAVEGKSIRRATMIAGAAAVLLIVAAALLQLWSVKHALAIVHRERALLRPQVAATLVGRSSTEDAYRRLAAILGSERAAPHWSAVVADLTARVPDDAYLTTLRARGDSLIVDGIGASASRVFDAIAASPFLAQVRAPAPVRRLSPEGADPTERFTFAGELRSANPAGGSVTTAKAAP